MNDDPLFHGMRSPRVPAGLEQRVLAAARAAHGGRRTPLDLVDEIWSNGFLRLAWVGAVAALLAANVASTPPSGARTAPGDHPRVRSLALAVDLPVEDLAGLLGTRPPSGGGSRLSLGVPPPIPVAPPRPGTAVTAPVPRSS